MMPSPGLCGPWSTVRSALSPGSLPYWSALGAGLNCPPPRRCTGVVFFVFGFFHGCGCVGSVGGAVGFAAAARLRIAAAMARLRLLGGGAFGGFMLSSMMPSVRGIFGGFRHRDGAVSELSGCRGPYAAGFLRCWISDRASWRRASSRRSASISAA